MIGASTERNIIRKKAFESRNFGFKVFYGKQSEGYNQSQHTQSTQEDGKEQHFVCTFRRNTE